MFRPSTVTRRVRPVSDKQDPALEKSLEKVRELAVMYRDSVSPEFENVGLPWSVRMQKAFEWLKRVASVCEKHEHSPAYFSNVKSALTCYESKEEEEQQAEEEPSKVRGADIPITFKCLDGTKHSFSERENVSFREAAVAYAMARNQPLSHFRFLARPLGGGSNYTIDQRSKIGCMPHWNDVEGVCVKVVFAFEPRTKDFSPSPHCLFSSRTVFTKHGNFEWEKEWLDAVCVIRAQVALHWFAQFQSQA